MLYVCIIVANSAVTYILHVKIGKIERPKSEVEFINIGLQFFFIVMLRPNCYVSSNNLECSLVHSIDHCTIVQFCI